MRPMFPRLAIVVALLAAQPAWAQAQPHRFDIPAEDLAATLDRISKSANVSLLYDPTLVRGLKAPAIHLSGAAEQAFASALAGSGLMVKRTPTGEYALVRRPTPAVDKPAPEPPPAVTTVPELLIVGRRSLNVDIPRRTDDIQPYRVLGVDDLADAAELDTTDLLRDLAPANLTRALPIQTPKTSAGIVGSAIDLRGLGTEQTLILVDGRRLPSSPDLTDFQQPDIAGIPVAAIERIETLSGTSGGLYGPGATGGVVNIVLRHDFDRPWIEVQDGAGERGDLQGSRVDGGFSYTSPVGTKISILADYGSDDGLAQGQRGYSLYGQQRDAVAIPDQLPNGSNVNVMSADGSNLVLIPRLGGQSLGSSITNLPVNSGGAGGNEAALLLAGAGRLDYRLSNDGNGTAASLLAASKTGGFTADIRQPISSRLELFGNLIFFSDRGLAVGSETAPLSMELGPGQLGNPFANTIVVTAPTGGPTADDVTLNQTLRATAGAIARLGAGWSLDADATWGQSYLHSRFPAYQNGLGGVDVFSPGNALAAAVGTLSPPAWIGLYEYDRMTDYSLRAAGPVAALTADPVTLTLSLERRDETNPGQESDADALPLLVTGAHTLAVTSGSAELRAPLVDMSSPVALIRGLELQAAGRFDREVIVEPSIYDLDPDGSIPDLHARYTTVAFTVGAKSRPTPSLTLRGSFATGQLPPDAGQIVPSFRDYELDANDPQRQATKVQDSYVNTEVVSGGLPSLQPEQAQTLSLGFIVQPQALPGFRVSADYTRIALTHVITGFASGDPYYFVAHEAAFPGHVVRAPLTAADAALGDTAGFITKVYATDLNTGRDTVDAIDLDVSYEKAFAFGALRASVSTSWEPRYESSSDPFGRQYDMSGTIDGPVRWRGYGVLQWKLHGLSAALTGYFIGPYKATTASYEDGENVFLTAFEGGGWVSSQVYLNANLTYQFARLGGHPVALRLAVDNLLDQAAPYDPYYGEGYSLYGDPRGRRFVVTASAAF